MSKSLLWDGRGRKKEVRTMQIQNHIADGGVAIVSRRVRATPQLIQNG